MIKASFESQRELRTEALSADLIIVGGGVAGTCAAITAAREGIRVVLVQDRPVLGGNSSSEVRLWILGATSHLGNNNRWAREGGVIDEILVENTYRNPEGNPLILDTILLEKVVEESNITLLLNTAVYEVEKEGKDSIRQVTAFCSQNSTRYHLSAPLFCDASGDGIVGFLAGAAFRMGAEAQEEFGEKFAPTEAYGELLGHTLYFYSKDTGKPVRYVAPSYALDISEKVPRYKSIGLDDYGCRLWWIEWGGRLEYGTRNRNHQVGTLEGGVRHLGPHQKLGRVSRGRQPDPGVGGHHSGQAREPPLRGRLYAHPARRGGAAAARRRGGLRRLGHRSAPRRRRVQREAGLQPVAHQGRVPDSVPLLCTARTSRTCFWRAASLALRTWPSARRG